ncbi:golgin subfamily A member 5 [Esox lucius]|uniref:Golgin subfamily A member 5 n=1 Tax=Esox lucius TaxID=8010 RepID=A0AAY5KJK8_ESOLU|nr:golgin subfamily A member 5 [Esox lucius]
MSWLVDLAGKAEDFLNKVDAGAASALTKPQGRTSSFSAYEAGDSTNTSQYSSTTTSYSSSATSYSTDISQTQKHPYGNTTSHNAPGSGFITSAAGNIKKSKDTLMSPSVSPTNTLPLGSSSSLKTSSSFVRPSKKTQSEQDVEDDLLFDFLNSSDPPASERREVRSRDPLRVLPEGGSGSPQLPPPPPLAAAASLTVPSTPSTPPSLRGMSPSSSYSSLSTSTHSVKTGVSEDGSAKESQDTSDGSDSGLAVAQSISYQSLSESPPTHDAPLPAPATVPPPEEQQSQVISSLRLENQLLRSEVASLNQELASIIQRAKDTQEELNQARLRTEQWNSDQSRADRVVRELRSQVDDLTEALGAKDGQLAVLKVRLEEADQLLKSRSSALEEAQTERSRILQDHTEGSSMQSQALTTIQERLREADMALRREQDSYRQMQSEFAARLSKVEAERQMLAEAVTGAERRALEEKHRAEDLQQQMKCARNTAETAKQELQDYKHKASRILQSKEKLISSLKEGSGLDGLEGVGTGGLELEELRHEKELQRDEIQKLQGQVQTLRSEIQDMEAAAQAEAETWREQHMETQEQHALLTKAKLEVEAEVERYKQELQYVEEENHRAKTALQSRIKDREDEIQKLRNQLTNKALSSSQVELESRLHQLTETLIQKQTMLEALGTEKSSLVFQLERMEAQLKAAQGGAATGGPAINMSSVESTGTRQRNTPILFNDQDSPGVYGQVRKAASTIDRFSIRLGIFLRRYPMARVFVILYMALLHLWVMIVLLTYSPEMHEVHENHPRGR